MCVVEWLESVAGEERDVGGAEVSARLWALAVVGAEMGARESLAPTAWLLETDGGCW